MSDEKPMRAVFGETLVELGRQRADLVVCDADVSSSTQTRLFAQAYPKRFFNFGIAEANMVAAAAGMAAAGLTPVVSSFAFLLALRAGDAVHSETAYNRLNVKIAGGYAGLSDYADGASHQSICDVAVMRAIPNITVIAPADQTETVLAARAMLDWPGTVYLRLSRHNVPKIFPDNHDFAIGRGTLVRPGTDVFFITTGTVLPMTMQAAGELASRGVSAGILHLPTVKPLDRNMLLDAAAHAGAIVTVEEHTIIGGLGEAVAAELAENRPVPAVRCGIPDRFGESGKYEEILARAGLDCKQIAETACRAIKIKNRFSSRKCGE
ncbi:MAG: hypothetical protein HZA50_12140 [Planctomycetes bacterium]|nr:hypothetical protein [Planctomycetota bacterium]